MEPLARCAGSRCRAFRCGNIDPLGITGTPAIDAASGTLYLDAMVADAAGPRHLLFALSLSDGSVRSGWPIDVAAALRPAGQDFDPRVQNERGALLILGGTLYVPYGGFFGDCGDYHGWVVGIPLRDPQHVFAWRTRGRGGGIWAPGGIAGDGRVALCRDRQHDGRRRVERRRGGLPPCARSAAFREQRPIFSRRPIGARSTIATPISAAPIRCRSTCRRAGGAQPVVLALGKDGRGYVLDRRNLGGIGGSLVAKTVATGPIRTAPAAYPAADGV